MIKIGWLIDRLDGEAPARVLHHDSHQVWLASVAFTLPIKNRNKRAHATAPYEISRALLEQHLENGEAHQYAFTEPENWRRDEKSSSGADPRTPAPTRHRRKYEKWVVSRDRAYKLIAPLVDPFMKSGGAGIAAILEQGLHRTWPAVHAAEIKRPKSVIYNALHRFLVAGNKNGLMPFWQYISAPGVPKFSSTRPGRRNTGELSPASTSERAGMSFVMTAMDIKRLQAGYKRHTKKKRSENDAYKRTLGDFYCESKFYTADGVLHVTLLPAVPSFSQFRHHGPRAGDPSKSDVDRGKVGLMSTKRLRSPKSSVKIGRAFMEGEIDSTSTNQTLQSEASSLKVLPAPNRTIMVDNMLSVNYVLGMYVGFEAPSALTHKLTLLNALEDKVAFCERYGVKIRPEEWISGLCRSIILDNGEGKSKESLEAVQGMEGSYVFAPSGFSQGKPNVETNHSVFQSRIDNVTSGSTQGRRKDRGEVTPAMEAYCSFHEYMPELLMEVLDYNNKEYIRPPLLEMRKADIEPPRAGIMLWAIREGYVASAPDSIDQLRVRCLPKLPATMGYGGLELFNPSCKHASILKGLVYYSKELEQLGYLSARQKRFDVHVNPSDLSVIWIDGPQLLRVPLHTNDPEASQLTLFDVISIVSDDKLKAYLYRELARATGVTTAVRRKNLENEGKKRRADEIARTKKPTKRSMTGNRAANLTEQQTLAIAEAYGKKVFTDATTGAARLLKDTFEDEWDFETAGALEKTLADIRGQR